MSSPGFWTAHLFPKIEGLLHELLASLTGDEWERQTISPKWKVKDVAAHLLDTQLRKLSIVRDGYLPPAPPITDLAAFINQLNQDGVLFYRRLSPRVLISLMDLASRESVEFHASLDPYSPAAFNVSWAGEDVSLNWFDTAREFTERWHHQQQIRLAVGRPGIVTPELYHPVLDCFLRALLLSSGTGTCRPTLERFWNSKSTVTVAEPGSFTATSAPGCWSIAPLLK